jgi:hypothetical protein
MHPPLPSRLGKRSERTSIDGAPFSYVVENESVFVAPSNPAKAYSLQCLKHDDGTFSYRICYYMIAHKPRMRGKWAFGQFAPIMSPNDLSLIHEKMRELDWWPSE